MRPALTSILSFIALLFVSIIGLAPAHAAQPFAMPSAGASQQQAAPATEATPQSLDIESPSGFFSSLLYRAMQAQQKYFRALATAFRTFDNERSFTAAEALISLSFAYGIFHAVGPGHGKVIVSSYILADDSDVKRGIGLAFLSSFMQAVTAIVAVGALAIVLGLTHHAVAGAVPIIERVSFLLVIGVGAMLVWRALRNRHAHDHAGHDHGHDHDRHHHHDDHAHEDHAHDEHAHHAHDGHAHMPTPQELRQVQSWRDMAAIVLAVGLRPCTGAILVLLFALTQGAFIVGALSSLAMSLGTAITVSLLASLTLVSKNVAFRIVGTADNRWTGRIERGLALAGGIFILILGFTMMASSFLMPAQPFM